MTGTGGEAVSSPAAIRRQAGRLAVTGGELEYDLFLPDTGGGQTPLVFLHGWTLDHRMWARQSSAFPDRPVVTLDRRGCGASSAPHDLSAEVGDILALMDHLGFERFILVGMSQAGQIAAELALDHPDRVAGLILQGVRIGPLAQSEPTDIDLAGYRNLIASGDLETMKAGWRTHPLMWLADPQTQKLVDAMLADYSGQDLLVGGAPRRAIDADILKKLTVPVLVISGDHDTTLRREVARELSALIPNATGIEFENAGHMCNLCAPAAYNAALQTFLDGL